MGGVVIIEGRVLAIVGRGLGGMEVVEGTGAGWGWAGGTVGAFRSAVAPPVERLLDLLC